MSPLIPSPPAAFRLRIGLIVCAACAWVAFGGTPTARAADRCYLWMFALQDRGLNLPANSHSFALFVRVTEGGAVEGRQISWMPRDAQWSVLAGPEPGMNADIPFTLARAQAAHLLIRRWGPYEIRPELYARAACRAAELESGRLLYKSLDLATRPACAVNCVHAISDLDVDRGWLHTGSLRGFGASRALLEHLRPWVVDFCPPPQIALLVAQRLNLPILCVP